MLMTNVEVENETDYTEGKQQLNYIGTRNGIEE
jgi:hypothetical protein